MNIEFLSPEKLKVVLNTGDLNKYDLDYMSISSQSRQTKLMVKDILKEAMSCSGFSTKNCKLLIEVLPGKNNGCVLYLTRLPLNSQNAQQERTDYMGKGYKAERNEYILSCGCLDDTIGAINCFAAFPDIPLAQSSLYDYAGRYCLIFTPITFGTDSGRLGSLLTTLSEFGQAEKLSPIGEAVLEEHGTPISNSRAVENMLRFFS